MKTWNILIALAISTILTGCESLSLRQANSALNNYHQALLSAEENDNFVSARTNKDNLSELAKEAASEATEAKDVSIKIALHRVAATAAWIANMDDAGSYAKAGNDVCNKEFSKAPNHCAMLAFIPNLILIDRLTDEVELLTASINDGTINSSSPLASDISSQLQTFFETYKGRANTVIADYKKIKAKPGTQLMVDAYKKQTATLFCSDMKEVNTAIFKMGGPNGPNMCTIYNLQLAAQKEGINANCLAATITKPAGC